ncbi:hypothetical protein V5O48_012971 [Marasmius crinis-equi]|uniref:Transmembrane protein n=1 Tax=Marasmius crinis-equi TaxID=585013 RepID=A0ABR3F1D5_9AGAR
MSWPRLLVFLLYVDSFLFLFTSGFPPTLQVPIHFEIFLAGAVLLFGVGLETELGACIAATNMCIIFYGSTKVIIYVFLVERVHLVWSPTASTSGRLQSKVWLLCMGLNIGYVIILVLMFIGIIHYWDDKGRCVIGLEPFADYALIGFDLAITVILTILFLYPLLNSSLNNPKIKAVALRTVVASVIALITSSFNIAFLAIQHGREFGFVCFGTCGIDVTINALTIFFVTGGADGGDLSESDLSRGGNNTTNDRTANRSVNTNANNVLSFKLGGTAVKNSMFTETHADVEDAHPLQVMVHTRTSVDRDGNSISKGKSESDSE